MSTDTDDLEVRKKKIKAVLEEVTRHRKARQKDGRDSLIG